MLEAHFASKHPFEVEVPSGLALYDVYFQNENLVVEIDGSTHFYGLTDKLLPKYVLKRKLLQ